ncbi:adenylyl-sulfate kinase [bacterium M21]|nr:adenylyl-sulfate kinase [bacterium M21]
MSSELTDQINVAVVGHVDHGKSTVVGRLLADTGSLPDGKLEQVKATCARNSKPFEYAFLLDALKDEQAQGITIDVARCFFKTAKRRYIIIDAPGHIEFLKNMVTGTARAEAAMIVIDAKEGIRENSKRHGYMASMLGIEQVAVLVNKMDLIDYDQATFDKVQKDYTEFLNHLGVKPVAFIPISGFYGDNVANRSEQTPWYTGPTVLDQFDAFKKLPAPTNFSFRFPVQDIYKFTEGGDDRRIFSGTVATGQASVGDEVVFLPSGKRSEITSIESFNTPVKSTAGAGEAIGFTLGTQVYIKPGELMVKASDPQPQVGTRFRVNLFWMGKAPMIQGKKYKLKIGTARVGVELAEIQHVLDASELNSEQNKQKVERHDVAECVLETSRPVAFDRVREIEQTGRFVIVDNYEIAGCGIIYQEVKNGSSVLEERLNKREFNWDKGLVSDTDRQLRYNHTGKLVIFTGQSGKHTREFAKALERQLFQKRCNTYYLGIGNVFDDLKQEHKLRTVTTDEHLQQVGELSRIMTDAGLLLITTLVDVDDFDLERLKRLNEPHDFFVVNVGENTFNQYPVDLNLAEETDLTEAVNQVIQELNAQSVLLDYCI